MTTTAMLTLSLICKKCSLRAEYVGEPMRVPGANDARKEGWQSSYHRKDGRCIEIWLCPTCRSEYDRLLTAPRAARKEAIAKHDAKWKETLAQAYKERSAIYEDPALNGPSAYDWAGGEE